MRFSITALVCGTLLVAAPLASHAYQLHLFTEMTAAVLAANGSGNFPDPPTPWYAVSAATDMVLIALGSLFERAAMHARRGAARPDDTSRP